MTLAAFLPWGSSQDRRRTGSSAYASPPATDPAKPPRTWVASTVRALNQHRTFHHPNPDPPTPSTPDDPWADHAANTVGFPERPGVLLRSGRHVYISRRRIRLAAYVTRLERVRESHPTGVQIPYPPPYGNPRSSDRGFRAFAALSRHRWGCRRPFTYPFRSTHV